jgi:hypothetical protein
MGCTTWRLIQAWEALCSIRNHAVYEHGVRITHNGQVHDLCISSMVYGRQGCGVEHIESEEWELLFAIKISWQEAERACALGAMGAMGGVNRPVER